MTELQTRVVNSKLFDAGRAIPPNQFVPGDVSISTITMYSEDRRRAFNLIEHVKSFEIFESITSPTVTAVFNILDSTNLIQDFPIIGEEFIEIEMQTSQESQPFTFVFRVAAVGGRETAENRRYVRYSLACTSPEIFINAQTRVTERVNGSTGSEIQLILREYLETVKPIEIEATVGTETAVLTGYEAFRSIDFLRQRAVSAQYASSSFVFYENKDGYHFKTVESMYERGSRGQIGDRRFFFDNQTKIDASRVEFRNILAFRQVRNASSLDMIQGGAFNNKAVSFDMLTGELQTERYIEGTEQSSSFKTIDRGGSAYHTPSFVNNNQREQRVSRVIPLTSDQDMRIAQKYTNLQAFVERMVQNVIHVSVYGDTNLTVGQVIECNFPEPSDITSPKQLTALDSGNYLITSLRHIVTVGARPQHLTSIECVKGSVLVG